MSKLFFIGIILSLALINPLSGESKYITYTQTFPWIGPEGEDPAVVFADLIEEGKLVRVMLDKVHLFYYDPSIGWINNIGKIMNDQDCVIKVFRDFPIINREHVIQVHPNRDPTTIIVDINGTGNYTTIQEGIDNSVNEDTVLVYPGTYYENINYIGKNITVASKYITMQNNSYIDSTIIDGNQNGSVVTFNSGEDSTAILCGFTIQNGSGTIDLYADYCGGGIFCKDSAMNTKNSIIKGNTSRSGGGIYVRNGNIKLNNVIIKYNEVSTTGGGGGIYCKNADLSLQSTDIYYNHSGFGGGGITFTSNSTVHFAPNDRCNIYLNYSGMGSDIYVNECNAITEIIVDTFTVMQPNQDFVNTYYNSNDVDFDILSAKIEPINQDLYVSPDGNDINSGLNIDEPLKTISYALLKIASDSTNPNNIHLAEGIYSSSLTGERFPLNARSYVGIIGESEESSILDGDNLYCLIMCISVDREIKLEKLTIQNGNAMYGGGIKFYENSNGIVKNVTIRDNYTDGFGGGIFCRTNSNPIFDNVIVTNNSAEVGGGVKIVESNPIFINCIISYNSADPTYIGTAGISCTNESSLILINTLLIKNSGNETAGILLGTNCYSTSVNNSFVDNNGENIIYLIENGNIELVNSILWDNTNREIYFCHNHDPNYAEISYTDIKNGESGIQTNGNGTYYWGAGNINQAPLFVDSLNDNYQLQPGSTCIDAGTPDTTGLNLPATDLAGNTRIFNGRIDIGAYEYQGYGIDEPDTSFIHNLYLFKNTPNTFKESTTISFISADYERIKEYTLSVYNTKGQLVRRYKGKKDNFWVKTEIVWDGTDEQGRKVAPGTYFYKLEYNGHAVVRKMVRLR